jgi:hypothetical protein
MLLNKKLKAETLQIGVKWLVYNRVVHLRRTLILGELHSVFLTSISIHQTLCPLATRSFGWYSGVRIFFSLLDNLEVLPTISKYVVIVWKNIFYLQLSLCISCSCSEFWFMIYGPLCRLFWWSRPKEILDRATTLDTLLLFHPFKWIWRINTLCKPTTIWLSLRCYLIERIMTVIICHLYLYVLSAVR